MKVTVEISDGELKREILNLVAKDYKAEYSTDRRRTDAVVKECVREIIYQDKERIIDRIVAQASRECGNLNSFSHFRCHWQEISNIRILER